MDSKYLTHLCISARRKCCMSPLFVSCLWQSNGFVTSRRSLICLSEIRRFFSRRAGASSSSSALPSGIFQLRWTLYSPLRDWTRSGTGQTRWCVEWETSRHWKTLLRGFELPILTRQSTHAWKLLFSLSQVGNFVFRYQQSSSIGYS